MKIHVKYFASVRDLMKTDAEDLNIAGHVNAAVGSAGPYTLI